MASAALRRGACPQSYRMYCFVQIVAVWDQGSLPSAARGQSIRKWRPHPPAESPGPSTCTSAAAVANLAPAKDGLREVMLASSLPQKSREDDGTRERSASSVLGLSGMERNGHTRRDSKQQSKQKRTGFASYHRNLVLQRAAKRSAGRAPRLRGGELRGGGEFFSGNHN